MKLLSKDFTRGEKIVMILLSLVLVGMVYYFLVDRPVRTAMDSARKEKEALVTELTTLQGRIARLEEMQAELEYIQSDPKAGYMGSYNNSKEELDFLNELLEEADEYTVTFTGVTRDGDQVRRNFNLKFQVKDYKAAENLLNKIYACHLRCLLNDISYTKTRVYYNTKDSERYHRDYYDRVDVTATATFYETMVGGTADAGLPASGKAAS